jgi:hypothetical protein
MMKSVLSVNNIIVNLTDIIIRVIGIVIITCRRRTVPFMLGS